MTIAQAITTTVGAFIFPLLVRLMWGKMVDEWKAFGGLAAIILIVMLSWSLNHGAAVPFIYQSGGIWIDQANAVAIGVFITTLMHRQSLKKSLPTIASAVLAGIFSGCILFLLFQ
ncbi:hypothetical protein IGI66_003569 [Enterococcus sp. AZ048]|uniref:Lin0368 family putative glycerol transporter subunit n=1 Tax=Enterococcus sp. AZ048 TaxID=2774658 RepID=UPI003F22F063